MTDDFVIDTKPTPPAKEESTNLARLLYDLTSDLAVEYDLATLLHTIIARAVKLLRADAGVIDLCVPAHDEMEVAASCDLDVPIGSRIKLGEGIAGQIALVKQSVIVDDYQRWEQRTLLPEILRLKAAMGVPMFYRGVLIGALIVALKEPGRVFSTSDEQLLSLFAGYAASAVQNARLLAEKEQHARELAVLYEVARGLTAIQDLPQLLQNLVKKLVELFKASSAGVAICHTENQEVELVAGHNTLITVGSRVPLGGGVIGQVVLSRQAVIVNDYPHWVHRLPDQQDFIKASMGVPMLVDGALIGVMFVGEAQNKTHRFTEAEARLLTLFAGHIAGAIHNLRLLAQTQQRAHQITTLYELTRDLAAQYDLPTLLQTILERAVALSGGHSGAIILHDTPQRTLTFAAELRMPVPIGEKMELGEGLAGQIALTLQPLILDDYQQWEHRSPLVAQMPFKAAMGVPMVYQGELVGVLALAHVDPLKKFTQDDAQLLSLFASHAAGAVHGARLLAEQERHARESQALYEATRELSALQEMPSLLQTLLEHIVKLMRVSLAGVLTYDAKNQEVELIAAKHAPLPVGARLPVGKGIAGQVALTSKAVIVNDYPNWSHRVQDGVLLAEASIGVPMMYNGVLIGVMIAGVARGIRRVFTEADTYLLSLFAGQAASAIHNAQLLAEKEQRARESLALYEATNELTSLQEMPLLLQSLVERISGLMAVTGAGIFLYQPQSQELELTVGWNTQVPLGTRVAMGAGIAGQVAQKRDYVIVEDFHNWPHRVYQLPDEDITLLGVPMLYSGDLLGVMVVGKARKTGRPFSAADAHLLSLFAGQAAGAIHNARLLVEKEQRAQETLLLYEVARDLSAIQEVPTLLQTLAERAAMLMGVPFAFIYTYDAEHQIVELAAGLNLSVPLGTRLPLGVGVGGQVALTHDIVIVDDYTAWERRIPNLSYLATASLGVPMLQGSELLGVIAVGMDKNATRKFSRADARLLSLFATQAASALYGARLLKDAQTRAAELTTLYENTRELGLSHDVDGLLQTILDRTHALMVASFSVILLHDVERRDLEVRVSKNTTTSIGMRIPIGEGVAGQVAATGQPLVVNDYQQWSYRLRNPPTQSVKATLGAPMAFGGDLIGVILVGITEGAYQYTESDVRLLSLFAAQAASALQGAHLLQEARKRAAELTTVYENTRDLSSGYELDVLLQKILDRVCELLKSPIGGIALFDAETQTLVTQVGKNTPLSVGVRLKLGEGLMGRVAETREVLLVNHYDQWLYRSKAVPSQTIAATLGVPMLFDGDLIGVISVGDHLPERLYTPDDVRLLSLFATQAASAVHDARLLLETRRRATELAALYNSTLTLGNIQDGSSLLSEVVERAVILMRASYGSLCLYDAQAGELVQVYNHNHERKPMVRIKIGEGLTGRVAQTRKSMVINDYANWSEHIAGYADMPLTGVVSVPMLSGGELIGVLVVAEAERPHFFTPEDVRLLEMFAAQAASAMHNARLYETTIHQIHELSLLYEAALTQINTVPPDLESALQHLAEMLFQLEQADSAMFLVWDEDGKASYVIRGGWETTTQEVYQRIVIEQRGVCGWVVQTGDMLNVPDTRVNSLYHGKAEVLSELCVPIKVGGQVRGIINLESTRLQAFGVRDQRLLTALAAQLAGVIENVRLYQEGQRQLRELGALLDVVSATATTLDQETLLNIAAEKVTHALQVSGCILMLLDDSQQYVMPLAKYQIPELPNIEYLDMPLKLEAHWPLRECVQTRQPMLLHVEDRDLTEGSRAFLRQRGWVSELLLPLIAKDNLLGLMALYFHEAGRVFLLQDVTLGQAMANQAALAIENARLYAAVQTQLNSLQMAQKQLEKSARLAGIGQLAAGIAHEINNPLSAILGFAELAQQEAQGTVHEDLMTILKEARQLKQIVQGLLDFARPRAPRREPTDLNNLIAETLQLLRYQLTRGRIQIQETFAVDLPMIEIDAAQIKQVLINLITNALHAMPEGGQMFITTRAAVLPAQGAVVSVRDTGMGIEPELLKHIFEPFFTTKEIGQGTGLGLAVSFGIIQNHQGCIDVNSAPGQGSEFSIHLPLGAEQGDGYAG